MPTIKYKLKDPKYCLLMKLSKRKGIYGLLYSKLFICPCCENSYCKIRKKRLIKKVIQKGKYKSWIGILRPQSCIDKFGE